jgi:hypothetical protein
MSQSSLARPGRTSWGSGNQCTPLAATRGRGAAGVDFTLVEEDIVLYSIRRKILWADFNFAYKKMGLPSGRPV